MKPLEYFEECFDYQKDTGHLIWKVRPLTHFKTQYSCNSWNTKYSNTIAGSYDKDGYLTILLCKKRYRAHKIVWLLNYKEWPANNLDHIDRKSANNKLNNLRIATCSENNCNRKKPSNNTSGQKGVEYYPNKKKWRVRIQKDGKRISQGYFKNFEDAKQCYLEASKRIHGEYACE